MNPVTITNPDDPTTSASAGFDHAVGFFVDIIGKGSGQRYSAWECGLLHRASRDW